MFSGAYLCPFICVKQTGRLGQIHTTGSTRFKAIYSYIQNKSTEILGAFVYRSGGIRTRDLRLPKTAL